MKIFTLLMLVNLPAVLSPINPPLRTDECYDKYFKEGKTFFNNRQYDKAEEAFKKANGCPERDKKLRDADDYLLQIKAIKGQICYEARLKEGKKAFQDRNYAEAKIKFLAAKKCENAPANQKEADDYLSDLEQFLQPKDDPQPVNSGLLPETPPHVPPSVPGQSEVNPTNPQPLTPPEDNSLNLEKSVWDSVDHCRTIYAYSVFIQRFPKSPNAQTAQKWLENMRLAKPPKPVVLQVKQQKNVKIGTPVSEDKDERPSIEIPKQFVGKCEVTNKEFCVFLNEMGEKSPDGILFINLEGSKLGQLCRIRRDQYRYKYYVESGYEDYPVIFVTWYGADAYCKWLNTKYEKGYQLPSVSVLDYIAQFPQVYNREMTLTDIVPYVNSKENKAPDQEPGIAKCGDFKPNNLGFYHALGNVAEWCADDWIEDLNNIPANGAAYIGGDHKTKTIKGGAWNQTLRVCYFNNRNAAAAGESFAFVGFRIAAALE